MPIKKNKYAYLIAVEALEEIANTIGMKDWNFAATADPCIAVGVNCSCTLSGNVCHITGM